MIDTELLWRMRKNTEKQRNTWALQEWARKHYGSAYEKMQAQKFLDEIERLERPQLLLIKIVVGLTVAYAIYHLLRWWI